MTRIVHITFVAFILAVATPWGAPPPAITLVGKGVIDGASLHKSGLPGNICQAGTPANCVPKAILGGFGSDITRFLENEFEQKFVGAAGAFDVNKALKR